MTEQESLHKPLIDHIKTEMGDGGPKVVAQDDEQIVWRTMAHKEDCMKQIAPRVGYEATQTEAVNTDRVDMVDITFEQVGDHDDEVGDASGDDAHEYVEAAPFAEVFAHPMRAQLVDVLLRKHYRRLTLANLARFVDDESGGWKIYEHLQTLMDHGIVTADPEQGGSTEYRMADSEVAVRLRSAQVALLSGDTDGDSE